MAEIDDVISIQIGHALRDRRIKLGITQQNLATALHVTYQQVQKYEKGRNKISAAKLWLASEALSVPVAWFYERLRSDEKVGL